jgi:hypothetical protein
MLIERTNMTNKNIFREAGVNDIDEYMKVRMAVKCIFSLTLTQ